MLSYLKVKDFAIIDELEVEFKGGLNVVTGETGAGKSIIINALASLVTARVSADTVRTGAGQAEVTGQFLTDDTERILKRVVSSSGRSRASINGDAATLARLEETGNRLISIYGQNDFQHLLTKESYTSILDSLLGLEEQRRRLGDRVQELRKTVAELSALGKEAEGKEREVSFLEFEVDEITKANLVPDEETRLKERLRVLKDSGKIKTVLDAMEEGLCEADDSIQAVCRRFAGLLKPFAGIEALSPLKSGIETVLYNAEDVLVEVRVLGRSLSYDPEELETLEERLSLIYSLKNKYGKTLEEIEEFKARSIERLTYLTTLSDELMKLQKVEADVRHAVEELANDLSLKRSEGAKRVAAAIVAELSLLSMEGLEFDIAITQREIIDEEGKDDIEFMISTNPGEPLKPLRRIASGGELSRIMLAVKKVVGGENEKTLIFDEVDAGIGGRVADTVGRRLRELAGTHQIVCITHLPQIAVYGNHHFLVEKRYEGGFTRTRMRELTDEERVAEIARMMGGDDRSRAARARAEEMLEAIGSERARERGLRNDQESNYQ